MENMNNQNPEMSSTALVGAKRRRGLKPRRVEQNTAEVPSTTSEDHLAPADVSPSTSPQMVDQPDADPLEILDPLLPSMLVECDVETCDTPTTSSDQPQESPSKKQKVVLNYGSESSGESDDDDMTTSFLPRGFRINMDPDTDPSVADYTSKPLDASTDEAPMGMDQPWSFYEFHWQPFPTTSVPPESRRERFSSANSGPTAPSADPYNIFTALWDKEFMDYIASETNRYAQNMVEQLTSNNKLHPSSRIRRWVNTTADELYVYFGIVIAMGVVVKLRLEEYWGTTSDIFFTPGFSAHMSLNRFTLLGKCLHFANNENMSAMNLDVSEAKLFKINPLITRLNEKFQAMYNLDQNICLDESLLLWKGWLDSKLQVPHRANAKGMKSYEVCESQTGYLWRFEIHAQKKAPQQLEDPINAATSAVVLRLLNGLENRGHTVWMDDFYNSPALARRLKALRFDCAGTLRANRKFVPQALQELSGGNMRHGQFDGFTSGDVDVMVFRDANRLALISTYHGNARDRTSTKPLALWEYYSMMGGVDKRDQMLAMYPIERKRTKVWYKQLFRRLLNVSIFNAFVIHKRSTSTPLTHHNFRLQLVRTLLSKHRSHCSVQPSATPNVRADVTHRLAQTPMGAHQRMRRKCSICRKRVHTYCVGCNKPVCKDDCFVQLHS